MQKTKRLSIDELKASSIITNISQNLEAIKGGVSDAEICHYYISADGHSLMDECTGQPVQN